MTIDPLRRFSTRAAAYALARPTYPSALCDVMRREMGLLPGAAIVDVGSGTGKLTEVLLDAGYRVAAVEPNAAMRVEAEAALGGRPGFGSIDGTAQATTLPAASVDAVTAGQAFHWFDAGAARDEWERIVRPGGWAVLVWNLRRETSTPFMQAYDALIHRFATDAKLAAAERADEAAMSTLFRGCPYASRMLAHTHRMDLATLAARATSSSFMPDAGDDTYEAMLGAIDEIYAAHADHGFVSFEYDTPIFYGRLGAR